MPRKRHLVHTPRRSSVVLSAIRRTRTQAPPTTTTTTRTMNRLNSTPAAAMTDSRSRFSTDRVRPTDGRTDGRAPYIGPPCTRRDRLPVLRYRIVTSNGPSTQHAWCLAWKQSLHLDIVFRILRHIKLFGWVGSAGAISLTIWLNATRQVWSVF